MPTIDDYLNLISSQHAEKPKFSSMVEAVSTPALALLTALKQLPTDFSLDEAIGAQLDAVGEWIGRSRTLETPLEGVYFSFDISGLGFDEGTWNGRYDPLTELTDLPDESYRALLRVKAAANLWDGSNEQLYTIFSDFIALFPGLVPFYQDNQDMTLIIGVITPVTDAVLRELILSGYIPLKPAGVRVNYIVGTANAPLFGFDMSTSFVAGFDTGAWGAFA